MAKGKKILIIGGNRFFGKLLTSSLLETGNEVTLLTRGNNKDDFGSRVSRIKMDRKDLYKDHPLLRSKTWDIIYDQVCYDSFDAEGACHTFNGRTEKYVFTSTQLVYGPGESIPESTFDPINYNFPTPVTRNVNYGEAKRQAEATFYQMGNFLMSSVRFPMVLAVNDHQKIVHFHVEHILKGLPIYFPNMASKISLINSDDASKFLASLNDNFISGPVNCCPIDPIRIKDLIMIFESELKSKAILVDNAEHGDTSPVAIENSWYMDNSRLNEYNFMPSLIAEWLPKMTADIADDFRKSFLF